jgi:hypothetical protein
MPDRVLGSCLPLPSGGPEASAAALLQLYTIDDGELVPARGSAANQTRRLYAARRTASDFSADYRGVATFLRRAAQSMTTRQQLARRLRVPIAQSQKIAHVLGSPAGMIARAVGQMLPIA